jgi:hypothetical protein
LQVVDGSLIVSASDLVGHLACAHLTVLERQAAEGLCMRPVRLDPALDVPRRGPERSPSPPQAESIPSGNAAVGVQPDEASSRNRLARCAAADESPKRSRIDATQGGTCASTIVTIIRMRLGDDARTTEGCRQDEHSCKQRC